MGAMGRRLLLGLMLAGLVIPFAASQVPYAGSFTLRGIPEFEEGQPLSGPPLLVYLPRSAYMSVLNLTAPLARMCYASTNTTELLNYRVTTSPPADVKCEWMENFRMTLGHRDPRAEREPHWGHFAAILGGQGHGVVTGGIQNVSIVTGQRYASEARSQASSHPSDTSDPAYPDVTERLDEPHIRMNLDATGTMAYSGAGVLKLYGPDVWVSAGGDKAKKYVTGWNYGDSPVLGNGTQQWITLWFDQGELTFDSGSPDPDRAAVVAFERLDQVVQGSMKFQPLAGSLTAANTRYEVSKPGREEWVTGTFSMTLVPRLDNESDLSLSGTLDSTTLRATALRVPAGNPVGDGGVSAWGSFLVPALVVGGICMGCGVGMMVRRRPREEISAEEAWEYASLCMQAGHFGRALPWVRRARAQAPKNAALAGDEARCRMELDDLEGALRCLAEADARSGDGEYALLAARILRLREAPVEQVRERLDVALKKTPALLPEVRKEFPEVFPRPSWRVPSKLRRDEP